MERPVLWEELSTKEISELLASGRRMVIFPVGSIEQHANHLPVNVDILCATEVAKAVSARTGVPVLPPLAYGNSQGHVGWPGTLSLRPETLQRVVEEIGGWLHRSGVERVLILNGHLTNPQPLSGAIGNLMMAHPGMRFRIMSWWDASADTTALVLADTENGGFHANDAETSMLLHLRPDLVRMQEARDETAATKRTFFSYFLRYRTRSGATGNPLLATREKGEKLFSMVVESIAAQVRQAQHEEPPFPQGVV
ncbi:MAG: creatininase family protein [Candidatus Tectomicrobia bacterium]|nr:creatininase family protein [Candidatus Tectomicrobia bacterium]